MAPFDYLSVLISIVLGLGITQLLSGFGRWLEQRASFRAYGPAVAWALFLLLVHIQSWWAMFGLRYWQDWSFLQFLMVLLQPIVLYLLAKLIFPTSGSRLSLRENFYLQRPWFFGAFLFLILVSIVKDLVRQGSFPEPANLGFHGFLFLIGALALAARSDLFHRILAYLALLWVSAYIALLFATLA